MEKSDKNSVFFLICSVFSACFSACFVSMFFIMFFFFNLETSLSILYRQLATMSACKNSDEFPFLSALNIKNVNPGVSDHTGLKAGSGKIHPSYSPGTGEVIASTSEGTLEDYTVVFF